MAERTCPCKTCGEPIPMSAFRLTSGFYRSLHCASCEAKASKEANRRHRERYANVGRGPVLHKIAGGPRPALKRQMDAVSKDIFADLGV